MNSEADIIQEENTGLLDHVKVIQKDNSDITGELSNVVANHAHTEGKSLKLNTMASKNIKAIEEMRKKNDKATTEKADLESKVKRFSWINEKTLNELENSSGQVASLHKKFKVLNNANH